MPGQAGQMYVKQGKYTATYSMEVGHTELGKSRNIKGSSREMVLSLAQTQLDDWNRMWQAKVHQQKTAVAREDKKRYQEEMKAEAARATTEAKALLARMERLLEETLSVNDAVDWEKLKTKVPFGEPQPKPPINKSHPPQPTLSQFEVPLGLADKVLAFRRKAKEEEAELRLKDALLQWRQQVGDIDRTNQLAMAAYTEQNQAWVRRRDEYEAAQTAKHTAIDEIHRRYLSSDPATIVDYCDFVLTNSRYPEFFSRAWELDYNPETKILIVDYALPAPTSVPTLSEVKYTATTDQFTSKNITKAQADALYDSMTYQIILRTIHELFEADVIGALDAITFNGQVTATDAATGNEVTTYIASVQARASEFSTINLAKVDPKACFRQLKGVGSSKLHSVTAVAPVQAIRREDDRFVAERDVAHQLDEGYNLASMHWEDFEHLIREVFAKEFSAGGGEVKVTQASRDGGVDAIAFDPDPIRGGKIVIQAKRYTATVGVSAVRDLYGTVMNEGATKGILVTTSDFGPDAFQFANGKPITLLSGANLLFLLEKHGHKARIDLKEARAIALQEKAV